MVEWNVLHWVIVGVAAFLAGVTNALAGGGTLITFPILTALGLPAVVANITNTVALCPGYIGGIIAQRADLVTQKRRVWMFFPAGVLGGVAGGYLLLRSGEKLFSGLVPFLILLAALLLALGEPVRAWVKRRTGKEVEQGSLEWVAFPVIAVAAIYGGYFGAGLSVIFLAVLGVVITDSLTRLNALKQVLSLATNLSAAIFFVFSGQVNWLVAGVMAVCALGGGTAGGKLAGKINPTALRWVVVSIGVIVAIVYFLK